MFGQEDKLSGFFGGKGNVRNNYGSIKDKHVHTRGIHDRLWDKYSHCWQIMYLLGTTTAIK